MWKPAIQGTCLCETVTLAARRKPLRVTQCNCSVCRRYGTLWAYYKRSSVTISAPRGGLASYSTRKRGLRFLHCKTCGCVITWQIPGADPEARCGVNARLFDHHVMANVTVKVLDGDKTWRFVDSYIKPAMFESPY